MEANKAISVFSCSDGNSDSHKKMKLSQLEGDGRATFEYSVGSVNAPDLFDLLSMNAPHPSKNEVKALEGDGERQKTSLHGSTPKAHNKEEALETSRNVLKTLHGPLKNPEPSMFCP